MNKVTEYEELVKNVDKMICEIIKSETNNFTQNIENDKIEFSVNNSKEMIDEINKISLFIQDKLETGFSDFEFNNESFPIKVNLYTKIFYKIIFKEIEELYNNAPNDYISSIIFERKIALEKILTGKSLEDNEDMKLK